MALCHVEPLGVAGVICPDEAPLLGFISLVAPLIAMGNRAVVLPSERYPLAATDLYQVLETSDVPAGVINIVTGGRDNLLKTLAEHDDVDALWVFGSKENSATAEKLSIDHGLATDWYDEASSEDPVLLRPRACCAGEEYLDFLRGVTLNLLWIWAILGPDLPLPAKSCSLGP